MDLTLCGEADSEMVSLGMARIGGHGGFNIKEKGGGFYGWFSGYGF